jgi:imidazole glycerol-phosphate synthase subunit HisH
MRVVLVDYGSGNLRSAAKALERAARDAELPADVVVTSDPEIVEAADRVVLPGQGAFADCLHGLLAVPGLKEALETAVMRRAVPFLGICVGMQLMADRGLEHGVHQGLGWIGGDIVRLEPTDPALKVPQMGWNELRLPNPHPVFAGLGVDPHAYFVHSYAMKAANPAHVLAEVDFDGPVVAAVGRDNLVGTQFHPEKSQAIGLRIVANFLEWTP